MKFFALPLLLSLLLLGTVTSCSSGLFKEKDQSCELITVAAFDIGSGSTKMMVADKNPCSKQIKTIYTEESRAIGFAQDLQNATNESGELRFSDSIIKEGIEGMRELNGLADTFNPQKKKGAATQAFRRAQNGEQLLQRWRDEHGMDARIVTQKEEAILGYQVVQTYYPIKNGKLLVWDMGGGSQQLTWYDLESEEFKFFNTDIASVTFKNRALKWLGRDSDKNSPNPISADEAKILFENAVNWIKREILTQDSGQDLLHFIRNQKAEIRALGGVHGASLRRQLDLTPDMPIKKEELKQAIQRQAGKTDQEVGGRFAATDVTNLILVRALMHVYGIESYHFMSANLNEGIILFL